MGAIVFYESANELATLSNTFSVAGVATDPTTVSLTITTPGGVSTTYTYAAGTVTKTGTGIYTKGIACSEDGVWRFLWEGTGAASDAEAGTWTVLSVDGKLYCTVEELKSRLGGVAGTTSDFELRLAAEAVSRTIEDHCNRHFWSAPLVRTYVPTSFRRLAADDLVSVTTLKTDQGGDGTFEVTWPTSDYQLLPVNAATWSEARPYTEIRAVGSQVFPILGNRFTRCDRIQVTGVFGWPAVPAAVKQAALILAVDMYKLKDAPFGVQAYGDYGVRIRDNPRATALLAPYRKSPVLVG